MPLSQLYSKSSLYKALSTHTYIIDAPDMVLATGHGSQTSTSDSRHFLSHHSVNFITFIYLADLAVS